MRAALHESGLRSFSARLIFLTSDSPGTAGLFDSPATRVAVRQPGRTPASFDRKRIYVTDFNSLGLAEYHQLVLAPIGGGDWPVMVYVRELPEGFPRGNGLTVDLTAVGLYFKNWSYPYDGGMGLAPVIVADTIDWRPATAPVAPPLSTKGIWVGGAAALMAAIGFTSFVMRRTRRPAVGAAETPDFARLETKP